MSADLAPALALAEKYGIALDLVDGDRLHWRSRGPTPDAALEALKAAKGELIDLLVRYHLDSAGGLAGDDLLAALQAGGFAVRRYGFNAALDDALGGALDRVPPMSLLHTSPTSRPNTASRSGRSGHRTASREISTRFDVRKRLRSVPGQMRRTRGNLPSCGPESCSATSAFLASGPA